LEVSQQGRCQRSEVSQEWEWRHGPANHANVFWNPNCLSDKKSNFLYYLHDETKLNVHKAIVTHLSSDGVHLANGDVLKADAVTYTTS